MSTFLMGPINNNPFSARYNIETLHRDDYRRIPFDIREGIVLQTGINYVWPRSSFTGQDYVNMPMVWECRHQQWEYSQIMIPDGQHTRKKITGVTRNSVGTAVNGITVNLYNTTTGALVDSQVSDSAGNYTVTDPNGVSCFVVAYLAGSPDTAGTTKNNLTGT
ncbi:MAG: hypothetical protein ACXV2C_00240 [Candidatus Bathyarchaeia archaeon]